MRSDDLFWTPGEISPEANKLIDAGDAAGLQALLKKQPDLARKTNHVRWTLLHFLTRAGVQRNRLALCQALIDAGADVNAEEGEFNTPLHYAVRCPLAGEPRSSSEEYLGLIRLLLDEGARVRAKNLAGLTPLHTAVSARAEPAALELLIARGAPVNDVAEPERWMPIHGAAAAGRLDLVEVLLKHGANRTARDGRGMTPAQVAANARHPEIARLLAGPGTAAPVAAIAAPRPTTPAPRAADPIAWQPANGPYGGAVPALAVSGTSLFAGTSTGIFRSDDAGARWTPAGLPTFAVNALLVNNSNILAGTFGGVFRSSDNGRNWSPVNGLADAPSRRIRALASRGASVFAGTDGGVYRSRDGGQNWVPINTGLTNTTVLSLTTSATHVFAGTSGGVFRSADDGASWTHVYSVQGAPVVPGLVALGRRVLAGGRGVSMSDDDGATWTAVAPLLDVRAFVAAGQSVFAGTAAGIFGSTDAGRSWSATAVPQTGVSSFVVAGSRLFAGTTGRGVFVSANGGVDWTDASNGLPSNVIAVAVHGSLLLCATNGGGVHVSSDRGQTWTTSNQGLTNLYANELTISGSTMLLGTANGLFRSVDNAAHWERASLPPFQVTAIVALDTSLIVAGVLGVFRSEDAGVTWTQVNANRLLGIVVLAASGTDLFAASGGASGGVLRSTDRGATWTATGYPAGPVTTVAAFGPHLLASRIVSASGMSHSSDGGATWTPTGQLAVETLFVSGSTVYAGGSGAVLMSSDGGLTWSSLGSRFSTRPVRGLAVDASGYVFAGTYGAGVFQTVQPVAPR